VGGLWRFCALGSVGPCAEDSGEEIHVEFWYEGLELRVVCVCVCVCVGV
jgi:hypothetical protein